MLGVLKCLPLLWGKTVSLSLWRLCQPRAWSFLPSLLHTVLPHPILTSAQFHRPALFHFFFWIIFIPFRTCSLLVSTLSPPLPHFSAELFLTSYFPCSCSLHISPYLNTFSLLSKFSIVPASFHSALCQCSSQTTNAVSEIFLTRGSRSFKM